MHNFLSIIPPTETLLILIVIIIPAVRFIFLVQLIDGVLHVLYPTFLFTFQNLLCRLNEFVKTLLLLLF